MTIDPSRNVGDLKRKIEEVLKVPLAEQALSRNPDVLKSSADPRTFNDLSNESASLSSLSFQKGEMVYVSYVTERTVEAVGKVEKIGFGQNKMTVEQLVAKQVKIVANGDNKTVATVSVDTVSFTSFQLFAKEYQVREYCCLQLATAVSELRD